MASFPSAARRVRDRDRALGERLLALRECTLRFAPYGFRATFHHLVVTAKIPQRLEDDLRALERVVAELEQARQIWVERS